MKAWKRKVSALLLSAMVMSMLCVSAFAAEAGSGSTDATATVISAFQSGFQDIASNAMSMIAVAAPTAIGVAGVIFLARKAMSWFKGMAK